jgi:tetratricopeptide (TPR) repeat protein
VLNKKFTFAFMKRLFIYLSLFAFHFSLYAQQHDIDSLRHLLKTAGQDSNRVSAMNYLTYLLENTGAYDKADSLAHEALQIAQKINYKKGIAIAYTNIASNFDDKGDYPNALDYYVKALNIKKDIGDKHGTANSLNGIGLIYEKKGEYTQAIEDYNEAYEICQEIGDQEGSANALDNIGNTYADQSLYSKALENNFKSLKIRELIKDTDAIGKSYESIGTCYNYLGDYPKALDYYRKSLAIKERAGDMPTVAELYTNIGQVYHAQGNNQKALDEYVEAIGINKKIGNALGTAVCYNNMGESYMPQQKYNEALDNYMKGLDIFKQIGSRQGIALSYKDIGACYLSQKNYKEAIDYENKAIDTATIMGDLQIMQMANQALSNVFDSTGNDKKAFAYYKNYITIRDSINNVDNSKKTVQAEMNYEFDKKHAIEQAEQEKKDEVARADSKRQKIAMFFVIFVAIAIGVIAVIILRSLRTTRKQKTLIERQKLIVEEQKQVVEEKNKIVEEQKKDIIDSINYAKRIQLALLKEEEHVSQHLPEHFILFKPKDIVSGDFYWSLEKDDYFYVAAVDCTGHGVPGGFMSMLGIAFLNEITAGSEILTPAEILNRLRSKILKELRQTGAADESKDGMDISLLRINLKTKEMQWSGANNAMYIVNGDLKEVLPDKQPIGHFPQMKPFTNHIIETEKGSLLYIFSDGYADQFGGPKGKKFKYKQMEDIMLANAGKNAAEQKKILNEAFESWKGSLEQVDDVLIIGIRV